MGGEQQADREGRGKQINFISIMKMMAVVVAHAFG